MGVDTTGNTGGAFTGTGGEIVFRNNATFCIPNAANDNYKYPIQLNKGATTEGVPRFKQGCLFGTDTADANILDDYEEGTWTPSNSTSGFESGSSLGGSYTKIGNRVFFDFRVKFSSNSSGVSAYVDGFPFTSAGGGGDHDHGASITYTDSSQSLTFLMGDGESRIYIYITTGSQPTHASLSTDYVRAQGQMIAA